MASLAGLQQRAVRDQRSASLLGGLETMSDFDAGVDQALDVEFAEDNKQENEGE